MASGRIAKLHKKLANYSLDIAIPVYFFSLLLELAHFFPTLGSINVWDEASYVRAGWQLLTEGIWPALVASPLMSLLYALTALPVKNSPDYFVQSIAIGRIFLFTLIYFCVYFLARELKPYANPWVMLAMVVIIPVATTMFLFPSDILFAGLSGLAFWQMLAYYNHRKRNHLWWASGLMGLGMLARAEGLLLIGVMLIVVLLINLRNKDWYKHIISVLVPFTVLVGGYILVFGLVTGNFETGLSGRTFNNFESGHEVIYSKSTPFIPTISARLESRKYFGTPEENNNSVFRAILRNPNMYLKRLKAAGPSFFRNSIKAYGNKFLLIFIWLSLRGLIKLIHDKHYPLALMGILWFVPLGVGWLNTFFREGYFLMPFFVLFALMSIGLQAILENFDSKDERIGLVAGSIFLIIVSLAVRNTSMLYRGILFIFGLVLIYKLRLRIPQKDQWRGVALWFLLAIILIIRGGYQPPALPRYGETDLEQSVYFLQEHLPLNSKVLAGAPANIWAARMSYSGINSYDIPEFIDSEHFLDWVQVQHIKAIYVDEQFPSAFFPLVKDLDSSGLSPVFSSSDGEIQVYFVDVNLD
ncbi:MAG: hypothetical protein GX142_00770 [Chloroflexi bacterium]|nr:hypothetical protein [Chloroflexota bacterium]